VEGLLKDLLVIGGASLDRLRLPLQTAQTAGGAGLYTSAAAHSTGAEVTMCAPRPQPMPDCLQPLDERIEWVGPNVAPEELPHFAIRHYQDGRTDFEKASFGKEAFLDPVDLPEDLSLYRLIHITPVGSGEHQLEFLQACRERGALRISAGTFPCMLEDELHFVRKVFDAADLFFMNEQEALKLFGALDSARTQPGKFLFITLGEKGAMVVQGEYRTHVPALHVEVLDPTGSGDTFCGATLAGIARGMHPVVAARKATSLAATMITAIGPTALWSSELQNARDPRIRLDHERIARVANLIGSLHEVIPFDFTGPEFPPIDHPAAVDYFFAATLQQFGFWEATEGKYKTPMIASIGGVRSKGSDYLWRAFLRKLTSEQGAFYLPSHQAKMSRGEMLELFRDDDGSDPMPELDLHLEQAHTFGKDMLSLDLTPQKIVDRANASEQPLKVFLEQLDHVGGYKEDPLRKKATLLALILAQRPERFLLVKPEDHLSPIIDYHLMRSCLRIGLVDVEDGPFREKLSERQMLQQNEEWAVRSHAFEVIRKVTELSGKSMGAVDWFFFNARQRCPEMTEPECERCPVDPVCAHRKELFQPVFRTTFY
jgi:hypothetical protein